MFSSCTSTFTESIPNLTSLYILEGTSIILPEITPDNIMDAFDRFEPNFWLVVPALLQALTMHPRLPKSKANAVKCILSGSAPLPGEVMRKFEEISGAKILEGYGGF